jgi:hypothetical protein
MPSSGMLHCLAPVKTDVSEELGASIIRVTRIGELGKVLAVTSNRIKLRRNKKYTKYKYKYKILFISSQRASVASYS